MHQEKDGIHYYNAGGWVDDRLTYITIDSAGARIHEYQEQPGDHDSNEQAETDSELALEPAFPEDAEYENING
jgi:hypothetical protein